MSPEQSLTSFVTELTPSLSSFFYAMARRHTRVSGERPAGRQLVEALTLSLGVVTLR
jgi:hypothetical protein